MREADARYRAWVAGLGAVAALPLLAGYVGWRWEAAELAGQLSLLACLALAGAPVRPRLGRPPALLTLRLHERLGWFAVAAAAVHVGAALLAEPLVLDYLTPTLPRYQLAGLVALLLLIVLVGTSPDGARRRLWRSHRGFQATHIGASALAVALIALHVVATDRYAHGGARRFVLLAVAALSLLLPLRRARAPAQAHIPARPRSAFGRHAWAVAAVLVAGALASVALLPGSGVRGWREPFMPRPARLVLDFDHAKHMAVNCLACHHNFADRTGSDTCVHCHRATRPDLRSGIEARFHDFCLGCHRSPPAGMERHGPVSGCATCHRAPAAPASAAR